METLKYKVISSEEQYDKYCDILHDLLFAQEKKSQAIEDEISLLTLLIETWDRENYPPIKPHSPVQLIKSLMKNHQMKARDLAVLLGVSKSYVSEILNRKKGLSKAVIRKIADQFKVRQDALNRPYRLKKAAKKSRRKTAKAGRAKTTRKAA